MWKQKGSRVSQLASYSFDILDLCICYVDRVIYLGGLFDLYAVVYYIVNKIFNSY